MSWASKLLHGILTGAKVAEQVGTVVGPFIPIPGVAAGIAIATQISHGISNAATSITGTGTDKMAAAVSIAQSAFDVAKSIEAAKGNVLTVDNAAMQALVQEQYNLAVQAQALEAAEVAFIHKCEAFATTLKSTPAAVVASAPATPLVVVASASATGGTAIPLPTA